MGSSPKMVLAELEFTQEAESPLKKNKKKNKKNGFIAPPSINIKESDDSDIVTPYQNGHYLNPVTEYAYQTHSNLRPSRARLRHSVSSELEDLEDSQSQLKLSSYSPDRNNYLSPLPPPLLVENERVGHSSLSNAITVAPSRTNLNDSNVFAGGRPTNANNLKRPNHHRNNRLNRHKGRSRTPDFAPSKLRLNNEHEDHCDILSKIDLSIKNKFGDWDSADEGEVEIARKYLNGHTKSNNLDKGDRRPYFIPKSVASDSDLILESKDDLNLPRLYKPYETVMATSRQVLNDKQYQICLSKDNADPNSILSQAKKTLNLVGGGHS